jgi:serine/threonine protein kinase
MDSVFSNKTKDIHLAINDKKEHYTIPEHIFINEDTGNTDNIISTNNTHIAKNGTFGLYTLPSKLKHFPGAYSAVIMYEDKTTLDSYSSPKRIVLKVMKTGEHTYTKIKQELDIYKKLQTKPNYSEHICKCYGINQTKHNKIMHNYLTLEYMTCDMFDYIFKHGHSYTVLNAYSYLHQIGIALQFLHKNDIIYNDLKLENIMISNVRYDLHTNRKTFKLKIIDFNCSTMTPDRKSAGGTLEYMSPELQTCVQRHNIRSLTTQSDIWSYGIITCLLFFHSQPYESNNQHKVIEKIQLNRLNERSFCKQYIEYHKSSLHIPDYLHVTEYDFDLILDILNKCFKTKPTKRANIETLIELVDKS